MEEKPPIAQKEAANDAQRKIGRNLLCFQQVECLLKFLLSNKQWIGEIDRLTGIQERKAAKIRKKSMGQLIEQFADEFLSAGQPELDPSDNVGAGWLSINFNYGHDSQCCERLWADLEALVTERNDLIHHFLPTWNSTPMDKIHRHLDQQHDMLQPLLVRLKADAEAIQSDKQRFAEHVTSGELQQQLELAWLRSSSLVVALGDIAQQLGDTDGWVPLTLAGQLLRRHEPEEVARLRERYGHKTLRQLLLATQLFDLMDQPAGKGAGVVYRIKPRWMLVFSGANQADTIR